MFAADTDPLSATLYGLARTVISPRADDARYVPWLLDFCLKQQIKLIIPTRDEELELLASISGDFRKKGIFINISSFEAVRICRDKNKFYKYCQEQGFLFPKVYSPGDVFRFPCFLKGRFGRGSQSAFKVTDDHQLKAFSVVIQEVIVQEFIDWPEYTVDYFADFNGQAISVVPRLRVSTFGGESFVGKTANSKTIIDATIALCQKLKLLGHNTVQLFYDADSDQVKFIEINPRFGGGASLGIASGATTPRYLLQYVLNQAVQPAIGEFTDNLYMFRYTDDIFVKKTDLKQ